MAKTNPRTKKKGEKHTIELSFLSVLLWGSILSFLLTLIFILGILVGRGFFPGTMTAISDLKGQIKRLQDMVSQKERYNPGSLKESDDPPKLDFYNKLATKKDEVKKNWRPEKPVETLKMNSSPAKVEEPQKTVQVEKVISKERKKDAEPLVSDMQYTVQLASIVDVNKAEGLTKQIIAKGFDAYYYETNVKGKTYYRVRCGKFQSRREALEYAKKIEKEAGLKGFVSNFE